MKKAILAAAAAVVLAAGAVGSYSGSAKAEEFVNVLTGGTSGVYYPLGVALTRSTPTRSPRRGPRCSPPRHRWRT